MQISKISVFFTRITTKISSKNHKGGYLLFTVETFLIGKIVTELCVRTVKNSRVFNVKNSSGVTSNLQTILRFRALIVTHDLCGGETDGLNW